MSRRRRKRIRTEQPQVKNTNYHVRSPKARTQNQKDYLSAMLRFDAVTCEGPAGTGKALLNGTKVYTEHGPKNIESLTQLDKVFGSDGKLYNINGIFPQGNKPLIKISFNDNTSIICSTDHEWTVIDRDNYKYKTKKSQWILDNFRKSRFQIEVTKPVNFKEQDLLIDPYILGCLIGDGSLTKGIRISSQDQSIINSFQQILKNQKIVKHNKYDYRIIGLDKKNEILDQIRILNLYGKRSYEKFIPEIYKYNSIENRISLLQGLLDTDGSSNGSLIEFSTSSFRLSRDIQELVESLGGTCKIVSRIPTFTYKGKKKDGKVSYRCYIKIEISKPFRLARKNDQLIKRTKYKIKRIITNIEKLSILGKSTCISVNSPNNLFLTEHFIPTHNTHLAIGMAFYLLHKSAVDKIVIARPAVEAGGEKIGFLPGDIDKKMDPFVRPIFDELSQFTTSNEIKKIRSEGILEIVPIGYMRGRTFKNAFIICDECQNIEFEQMKMLLTRFGSGSKLVLTGDTDQSDLATLNKGAFRFAIELLRGLPYVGSIKLDKSDVQRHPLVGEVAENWDSSLDIFKRTGTIGRA